MSSKLRLNRHRSIAGFLRDTRAVRRRRRAPADGLAGYSLGAGVAHRTFWIFSVWPGQASPGAFASAKPHWRVIRRLQASWAKPASRRPL